MFRFARLSLWFILEKQKKIFISRLSVVIFSNENDYPLLHINIIKLIIILRVSGFTWCAWRAQFFIRFQLMRTAISAFISYTHDYVVDRGPHNNTVWTFK